jgi:Tol biopolymer transport system component
VYGHNGNKDWPTQVYLVDLATGRQDVVSHTPAGKGGDADSMSPSLSDDGRYVAFASDATDLVAKDTNRERDVFLYDTRTRRVSRVSVDTAGGEVYAYATQVAGDYPTISGDGSTVAFLSDGNVTRDPKYANPKGETYRGVFVRRLRDGTVTPVTDVKGRVVRNVAVDLVSWDADRRANRADRLSAMSRPALNRNGTVVAFAMDNLPNSNEYYADFGVKEPHNDDVFVRDLKSGRTSVASVETGGYGVPAETVTHTQVSLDAAGTHVLFTAHAYYVFASVLDSSVVYLYDTKAKTVRAVSPATPGTYSGEGALSADGRTIAYSSGPFRRATQDYVTMDSAAELFRGALSGSAAKVWSATGANDDTFRSASLSANGKVLAFISSASLSPDDPGTGAGPTAAREDVYVLTS